MESGLGPGPTITRWLEPQTLLRMGIYSPLGPDLSDSPFCALHTALRTSHHTIHRQNTRTGDFLWSFEDGQLASSIFHESTRFVDSNSEYSVSTSIDVGTYPCYTTVMSVLCETVFTDTDCGG